MRIVYRFKLGEKPPVEFDIEIEEDSAKLQSVGGKTAAGDGPPAPWTMLALSKCPHCPLPDEKGATCPAARAIAPAVAFGGQLKSFDKVTVGVISERRTVVKTTDAQQAFGSMIGLLLATSGCPSTAYMRPMARFHLPFSDSKETLYRTASMFLLAQYMRQKAGLPAAFDLKGMQAIYEELEVVNAKLAERVRQAARTDSSLNAIILLDNFAKRSLYELDEALVELEPAFAAYVQARDARPAKGAKPGARAPR